MLSRLMARHHGHALGLAAVALAFGLLPLFLGRNVVVVNVLILVFIYATIGSAWNLIGGYTGQFALSNAVFYGLGAYTSTLLFIRFGVSPWLGMLAGGLIAAAAAIVIGYPCFRLGFHYFAIGTLVIGEAIRLLFLSWDFVGAAVGLSIPPRGDNLLLLQFRQQRLAYYYIALALMLLALVTTYLITRTRLVYYMRAIKGDPDAAQSLGIDVTRTRVVVFCITAFLTALPGSFMAQFTLFIDPASVLDVQISVLASLIPILGGVGTLWGPLLGAIVLIPLGEFTRTTFGATGKAADLVIFGLLIMLLAEFRPSGLIGIAHDLRAALRSRTTVVKPGAVRG